MDKIFPCCLNTFFRLLWFNQILQNWQIYKITQKWTTASTMCTPCVLYNHLIIHIFRIIQNEMSLCMDVYARKVRRFQRNQEEKLSIQHTLRKGVRNKFGEQKKKKKTFFFVFSYLCTARKEWEKKTFEENLLLQI